MALTDLLRFLVVLLFVALYINGMLTPVLIAALTMLTSTIEAFRMPAGSAITPLLLEPSYYTLGKAASYSFSRVSQLMGYIVSGGLIALIGSAGVLVIDAVTFFISAVLILWIRVTENNKTDETKDVNLNQIFSDFKEGISFLKGSRIVQMISVIGLVINFGLMPLTVFQTPYVSDYLNMGAGMLSYIKILMMVGMMVGAFVTPRLLKFKKGNLCVAAGIGMGISIVCMYVTPDIHLVIGKMVLLTLSMFFVGVGGGVLNVVIGGLMMAAVPQDKMGRMSGLNAAIMEASMPVGSFICSALALMLNVTQIFALFGICTILFYMLIGGSHSADILSTNTEVEQAMMLQTRL
ncbi:MAG: MFS transporter [Lachnospiraceae bacterium]|nr:MFS transporter [Lachnospiraceae bacterium]